MSENRFVIDEKTNYKDYPIILDTKTGDWWVIQDTMMGTEKLLNELNDQQATINKQDDEIKKLKRTERSWRKIHCCNKESNNCGIVIEQQNIISKLESDLQKIPPKIRELWIGED